MDHVTIFFALLFQLQLKAAKSVQLISHNAQSLHHLQQAVEPRCGFPANVHVCAFTLTFSHLADAFVQSDVQGREYSSYEQ